MKWYNYKYEWINLENCYRIVCNKFEKTDIITFFSDSNNCGNIFCYESNQERDAEFEKIKALMGIKDYTSCGC